MTTLTHTELDYLLSAVQERIRIDRADNAHPSAASSFFLRRLQYKLITVRFPDLADFLKWPEGDPLPLIIPHSEDRIRSHYSRA